MEEVEALLNMLLLLLLERGLCKSAVFILLYPTHSHYQLPLPDVLHVHKTNVHKTKP